VESAGCELFQPRATIVKRAAGEVKGKIHPKLNYFPEKSTHTIHCYSSIYIMKMICYCRTWYLDLPKCLIE